MYCLIKKKKGEREKILSKQQLEHNEFGIEVRSQGLKLVDFGSTLHAQCACRFGELHAQKKFTCTCACVHPCKSRPG